MSTHFYLSVFPMEALIASQLDPKQFGSYMATGSKKGSKEQIIFIEVEGGFGEYFDWAFAAENCVPHPNGDPKHSVYLGVYRILENTPPSVLGDMYLTTRDGRTIGIEKSEYSETDYSDHTYFVYHELCPVNPVIVSRLDPEGFGKCITNKSNKVFVPKIIYADLKVVNFDDLSNTGHIGSLYDSKIPHLMECISEVTSGELKPNKTLTRTHVDSFAFQTIDHGIYVSNHDEICIYRMPDTEEIKKIDYDWGRSAQIL